MLSFLGLLVPVAIKFFDIYLSRLKDNKEAWEAYQKFIREMDAYRAKRVYEAAKSQREYLADRRKNLEAEQESKNLNNHENIQK